MSANSRPIGRVPSASVQVEIPMADRPADAEAVVKAQEDTSLVAMAGHTRRFNPSHQ